MNVPAAALRKLGYGVTSIVVMVGDLAPADPFCEPDGLARVALVQQRVESNLAEVGPDGPTTLELIDGELAALRKRDTQVQSDSPTIAYYRAYWVAYLLYHKAVGLMQSDRFESGREPLREAVSLLEGIEPRDHEVLALLGLAGGLHLAYVPRHRILAATEMVNGYLSEALRAAPTNVRVLYANAIADFNTPAVYGGRKRVEKLLTNALDSPDHPPVGVTPNWGRREASVLLIRFLLDEDRLGEARALVDRALVRWPGSWEHRVFLANLIGEGR